MRAYIIRPAWVLTLVFGTSVALPWQGKEDTGDGVQRVPEHIWQQQVDARLVPLEGFDPNALIRDNERTLSDSGIPKIWPVLSPDEGVIPSPGLRVGVTIFDAQHLHSQGYHVAKNSGANIVHFVWMGLVEMSDFGPDTLVVYNSYSVMMDTLNQGQSGAPIGWGDAAASQYPNLAVGQYNDAHVALHQHEAWGQPLASWVLHFPTPGLSVYTDDTLPTTPDFGELLWPHIEVQQNAGDTDVYHVVAHRSDADAQERIIYWRFNGDSWAGPAAIDSNFTLGYVIAADPNSDQVTIVLHSDRFSDGFNGMRNVAYYESQTEGIGWIDGSELGAKNKTFITSYSDSDGPEAWLHIACAYDHHGLLHLIWDEQRCARTCTHVAIRHWNDQRGTIRSVAYGYWDNPAPSGVFNLNLGR